MRYLLGLSAIALAAALIGVALFTGPSKAQACVSVAEDRAKAEAAGIEWLGIVDVPFTDGIEFVYYSAKGTTYFSPVFSGCVSRTALPLGQYVAVTPA